MPDVVLMKQWRLIASWAFVFLAATAALAQDQNAPPPPAQQPQTEVAIALVLAVDASGSVDNRRFELQKRGYAAAFRNPQVISSIRSLMTQSIAVKIGRAHV